MSVQCKSIAVLLVFLAIIILAVMLRSKHFFRCFILSTLSGTAALFAVDLLSSVTGFSIAVNPVTLGISSVGGIPAVIMLLTSRLFLA